MFGTIDVTICALDSLNHLSSLEEIRKTMERVSLFCEPGGLFIFDVNTPYKHKNILGNNTFVYDLEDVYCVWQNIYTADNNKVEMWLDFFEKQYDGTYRRFDESITEIAFNDEVIEKIISDCGLQTVGKYDYDTMTPVTDKSEKIVYVTKKIIN